MTAPSPVKPLEWVGSALNDIRRLPAPVQDVVGYALHVAQLGEHPPEAKRQSTRGNATPRREIELIKERYRWARAHHATHYGSSREEC